MRFNLPLKLGLISIIIASSCGPKVACDSDFIIGNARFCLPKQDIYSDVQLKPKIIDFFNSKENENQKIIASYYNDVEESILFPEKGLIVYSLMDDEKREVEHQEFLDLITYLVNNQNYLDEKDIVELSKKDVDNDEVLTVHNKMSDDNLVYRRTDVQILNDQNGLSYRIQVKYFMLLKNKILVINNFQTYGEDEINKLINKIRNTRTEFDFLRLFLSANGSSDFYIKSNFIGF